MCGIHVVISNSAAATQAVSPILEKRLRNRGPDHLGSVDATLSREHDSLFLSFTSTVLSLRGDHVTPQPLVDDATGSVLCWNGEAWKINGQLVHGNDGEEILRAMAAASRCREEPDGVVDYLRSIEGPFAFAFFDRPRRRFYYGRDRLGRRSLLGKSGECFSLSSIADSPSTGWSEVEADGCYSIDLGQLDLSMSHVPRRHPWAQDDALVSSIGLFNTTTPPSVYSGLTRTSQSVKQLHLNLCESLRPRILNVPIPPHSPSPDTRIAILFSGGLDCTVLARVASDILPSGQGIDLINVAFENPRIASQHKGSPDVNLYELCPDRITGRKSLAELQSACPQRLWRFVTVNVPFTSTSAHRDEVIELIYPHNTEMDLSIAFALYFAARGQGSSQVGSGPISEHYGTPARVLLSGLGADELFGGYVRHPNAFARHGYAGLIEELKLDVSRLGKRNLGRDDRVMAHWGREVRFPYLDEGFVQWAIELPAWEKCDFDNPGAEGEVEAGKRVLRLLAQELGMDSVAAEKKRAIQFGARTAKMENNKVKGTTLIS